MNVPSFPFLNQLTLNIFGGFSSFDASGYLKELEDVKPFLESFGDKMPGVLWKEFYDLRARLENSLR